MVFIGTCQPLRYGSLLDMLGLKIRRAHAIIYAISQTAAYLVIK